MKNLKVIEGFKNRFIDGLPKEKVNIKIISHDSNVINTSLCNWIPFEPKNYTKGNMPDKGYLGTAIVIDEKYKGIGFNVWEQNNYEFVHYQLV